MLANVAWMSVSTYKYVEFSTPGVAYLGRVLVFKDPTTKVLVLYWTNLTAMMQLLRIMQELLRHTRKNNCQYISKPHYVQSLIAPYQAFIAGIVKTGSKVAGL